MFCIHIQSVTNSKKIHYQIVEGMVNTQNFHEFLRGINFLPRDESYLIMDNFAVHKANQACKDLGLPTIKELLLSKNITPLYLPPYTPQLLLCVKLMSDFRFFFA